MGITGSCISPDDFQERLAQLEQKHTVLDRINLERMVEGECLALQLHTAQREIRQLIIRIEYMEQNSATDRATRSMQYDYDHAIFTDGMVIL